MNSADARTIVVGGGVIGASIADQLTRRNAGDVVVCEQGQANWAATAQSGGLLRVHHTADCDIELAARSLPFFRDFVQNYGGYCGYSPTGFVLLVGPDEVDSLHRNVEKLEFADVKVQVLSPAELKSRFKALWLDGVAAAAFEPEGGYGNPAITAREMLQAARSRGASVLEGVSVLELLMRGDRVAGVRTNIGDLAGATVVVANGSWSARLVATAGIDLPVTPQRIGLGFCPGANGTTGLPACIDDTLGNYFRSDGRGVFFGVPCEPHTELDRVPAPLTAGETNKARRKLFNRIPALSHRNVAGTRLGVDGYTPDRRPLIGRVGPDGLYVATGMSGGGFKIAPAVGELAAQEIHTAGEHKSLAPYRPQRFAAGEHIVSEFPYQWM